MGSVRLFGGGRLLKGRVLDRLSRLDGSGQIDWPANSGASTPWVSATSATRPMSRFARLTRPVRFD